jgi:Mor family transcriptional regulator
MMPKNDACDPLQEWFRCLLADFGEASGRAIIRSFVAHCGGCRISVPDFEDLSRQERDRRIRAAFTGTNYGELSERFGISRRQIRYIIDGERSHKRGD